MADYLQGMDFARHNADVLEVWARFSARDPSRVPIILGVSTRFFILNSEANPEAISFHEYTNDPSIMLRFQVESHRWSRHNIIQDAELGPVHSGWPIYVDFQNYYEAAWFGCEVHYVGTEVPDATPLLDGDRKYLLFERGCPDPFGGLMARNKEYYEYFLSKQKSEAYYGLPIASVSPAAGGTDGPFTVACSLRGPGRLCLDMYEDPQYVHDLLSFVTEGTIQRIQAWRRYLGQELVTEAWGFADDSIQLISCQMYRDFVLPYHRRLVSTFSARGPNSIHLCGDAVRHFPTLRDELNIMSFDTGFPVDFAALRQAMGPDVTVYGGPHVELLRSSTPAQVEDEVERILSSGITAGGRFVLREGNNLAPGTPLENLRAMYDAGRRCGVRCQSS